MKKPRPLGRGCVAESYTGFGSPVEYMIQRQVMYMSAFEIISTILMIIALLFTAYNIGKGNRK